MEQRHENSKRVWLRRAGSFLSRSQDKIVDDYYASAVKSVGSYWERSGSRRIASGLSIAEEKILLPDVLGVHSDDRVYHEKRNLYYMALETKVPAGNGVELEIGLWEDNSKPLSSKNLPINVSDYLIYRQVIGHPWVAASQEEAEGNQLKQFYIYDPVKTVNSVADIAKLTDDAMEIYLQIRDNETKVEMMLAMLGIDYRDINGQTKDNTKTLRQQKLRDFVKDRPKDVIDLNKDRDFEVKYLIRMMENTQVLRKIGLRYIIAETGDSIGTTEEAVQFFKDTDTNSETIGILKAKLQEGLQTNKRKAKTTR